MGWNWYWNKSQQRKLTLGKKINLTATHAGTWTRNISITSLVLYCWTIPTPQFSIKCEHSQLMWWGIFLISTASVWVKFLDWSASDSLSLSCYIHNLWQLQDLVQQYASKETPNGMAKWQTGYNDWCGQLCNVDSGCWQKSETEWGPQHSCGINTQGCTSGGVMYLVVYIHARWDVHWGCAPGGVYVPCIYTHARWGLL